VKEAERTHTHTHTHTKKKKWNWENVRAEKWNGGDDGERRDNQKECETRRRKAVKS